jgi:hypothetical protein
VCVCKTVIDNVLLIKTIMSVKKIIRRIEIELEIFALNIFMGMVVTKIYLIILYIRIKNFFKGE